MKITTYEVKNIEITETQEDDGTVSIRTHNWDTGRSIERNYLRSQSYDGIFEQLAEHGVNISASQLFDYIAESAEDILKEVFSKTILED